MVLDPRATRVAWRLLTPVAIFLLAGAPLAHALDFDPTDWRTSDGGLTWTRGYDAGYAEAFGTARGLLVGCGEGTSRSCLPWPAGKHYVVVEADDDSGKPVPVTADHYFEDSEGWESHAEGCSAKGDPAILSTMEIHPDRVHRTDVYLWTNTWINSRPDCLFVATSGTLTVRFVSWWEIE